MRFNIGLLRNSKLQQCLAAQSVATSHAFSRRAFIEIASGAFAAMSGRLSGEPFSLERDGHRINFVVGRRTCWTIDPNRFDGHPVIDLCTEHDRISLALKNARFPNTQLTADFEADIRKNYGGWILDFATQSGIKANADFLQFLRGELPARGIWQANAIEPFDGLVLDFDDPLPIAFHPDWSFEVHGPTRTHISGLKSSLPSMSWGFAMNDGTTLGGNVSGDHTLFTVHRGEARWDVDLNRSFDAGWSLAHEADLFQTLQVESARNSAGVVRTGLLSQAEESDAVLRVHPGGGFVADSGDPFHLSLKNPRMAFALEPEAPQIALIADISSEPVWAHGESISLLMAGGANESRFEWLDGQDGEISPKLAPEALAAAFASTDETQFLMDFKEKRPIEFTWSDFVQPIEEVLAHLHLLPGEHKLSFDLTCGDQLHVLRPKDLLNLTFQFENLRLKTGFGEPRIVPNREGSGGKPPQGADVGDEGCPPLNPHLRCAPTGGPPKITVVFPPQHVAEQALYDRAPQLTPGISLPDSDLGRLLGLPPNAQLTGAQRDQAKKILDPNYSSPSGETFGGAPLSSRIAGPTRLVFELPEGFGAIHFNTESLLNWSEWQPCLDSVAKFTSTPESAKLHNGPAPIAGKPPEGVTSIEMPWRLMISPGTTGGWAHEPALRDYGTEVFEIWHTRLGTAGKDKTGTPFVNETSNDQTIRAIWSPDYRPLTDTSETHDGKPFRMSLDRSDRNEIVHLTSNFQIVDSKAFVPSAIPVEQLILSPMGGWLKSFGVWDPPQAQIPNSNPHIFTLEQWKHSATMGRDHYVRVVYKGYLLPFGHRASLVKVTERRFDKDPARNKGLYAYLHQRMFIVIQNPRRDYPVLGQCYGGRKFHFTRVDAVTTVTPTLSIPIPDQSCFWVIANGATDPFPMRFRFWDSAGNTSEADVFVVFADASVSGTSANVPTAINRFNTEKPGKTVTTFSGQKQAFAPPTKPGDTDYEVTNIDWRVDVAHGATADQLYQKDLPCFVPFVNSASIACSSIKQVNSNVQPNQVQFYKKYLEYGFDPKNNRGEAFLELATGEKLSLDFTTGAHADQAGALATPNTAIVGFSRKSGPIGGTPTNPTPNAPSPMDNWATGVFDAVDFFGGLGSAKILGGLKLVDIIAAISPGLASNLENAPKMLTQSLFNDLGVSPSDLQSIEKQIVNVIDADVPSPINRKLGPQKGSVDSNWASVQSDPDDPLKHAALIGAIIQYAQALESLVQNPGELVNVIWNTLSDYFTATLTPALENAVAPILDSAKQDVAQAISDLVASLTQTADSLTSLFNNNLKAIQQNLPDFSGYSTLPPIIQDLSKRIGALSSAVKSFSIDKIPSLFQQLAGIIDDLVQILERLGYLDPSTIDTLSARVVIEETKLYNLWSDALDEAKQSFKDAQQGLSDLEIAAMNYAAGLAVSSDAQTVLQTVRQIQNSAQWLINARNTNLTKTLTCAGQSQVYQVQAQLLAAAQALYQRSGIPQEIIDANNKIVGGLTLAQTFIDQKVEDAYGPIETALNLADSLENRLRIIQDQLDTLRTQINQASANPTLQATFKIQHFTVSLQYRAPFAIVPQITQLTDPKLNQLKSDILNSTKTMAAATARIKAFGATLGPANSALLPMLKTAFDGLNSTGLGDAQALLTPFLQPVTDAFNLPEVALSDLLRKAQQVLQTLVNLENQIEQGLVAAAGDIANAGAILNTLTSLIPIPKALTLSYTFHPVLKNFEPVFYLDDGADFQITAQTTIPIQPGSSHQPSFDITGTLSNFTIKLIGQPDFVDISFKQVQFTSQSGSSPNCHAQIKGVTFGQDLGFAADIAKLLDPSEGPFVEFPAGMIRTGFRFQVGDTPLGSFILMQLSFTVAVSLPYDGSPARCDFAISSTDSPFLLSEPPYGGGGFFRLLLGLDGVEKLEGALEFGVVADISIGPVSGGGYVVAGIYFSIEANDSKVCGFVHSHGHMDMFDIASVDVDVYVSICYDEGNVVGSATITVHVEVLFFSADFQITATYQFAGSQQDSDQLAEVEPSRLVALPKSQQNKGADRFLELPEDSRELAEAEAFGQADHSGSDDDCENVSKWSEYYKYFAA